MILKPTSAAKPWTPKDFDTFLEHYPTTAWPVTESIQLTGECFVRLWSEKLPALPSDVAVVLTPGLFAELLPRCFATFRKSLLDAGTRVMQTPARSIRTVLRQSVKLRRKLKHWLDPKETFLWCAHSKGALDAIYCLHNDSVLRSRCRGLLIVQPPIGDSWILNDCLNSPRGLQQHLIGGVLRTPLGAGCREITGHRQQVLKDLLAVYQAQVPTLQVVTWSVTPTTLLDSYHQQLNALRPGWAHDGQFYLDDQTCPTLPTLCLPRIDHAQPVLGGNGFDEEKFWRTALYQLQTTSMT